MAIAKLSIDLEARLAGLQAGLDKAGVLAEKSAARIDGAFARVGSSVSAIGAGLAASLGAAGLTAFVRSTVDGLDKLNDLADATGASVENLSALEDVAARTGTSVDTMGDALIKMNKALADAKPGSDQAAAFDALGLSIKELKALDPVEAFQKIAVALQGFASDGNKARLVQELFGRSLREVAPLLKDAAEAGKLVATVTKAQADEAERFNKELFALQKTATDASRALVGPFVAAVNEVIAVFREGKAQGKGFFETLWLGTRLLSGQDGGGATGSWEDDAAKKPSLPAITGGAGDKTVKRMKSATDERIRLAEFAARQLLELEQITAQETLEAWSFVTKSQEQQTEDRIAANQKQWQQYFEWYDQQQEESDQQTRDAVLGAKKAADGWNAFADQAARNIQDAIGNTLEATLSGSFENIGQMWKQLLIRMASEAAAARIAKELFGDFGGGGGGIGGSIGSLLALLPKFDGGTSFVPRDMVAMVHKGERIIPAAQNARGGGSYSSTIINNIDSRTDQAQVAQLVAAGVQEGQRQMLSHLKASGVLQ